MTVDMRSLTFRAQEWLADHFRWAQYPRQQILPRHPTAPFFRTAMPWELRGLLALVGSLFVLVGVASLAAIALIVWVMLAT